MSKLTQDELRSLLYYDEITGDFTWMVATSKRIKVGEIAGTISPYGYVIIKICKKLYRAHRLVFFYMTGDWPADQVDYINQIRNDNRWINLRECSNSQNQGNATRRLDNKSGFKGVYWDKINHKWRVQIARKHLGLFTCKEDAAKAYNEKALEIFGEFAHLNKIDEGVTAGGANTGDPV